MNSTAIEEYMLALLSSLTRYVLIGILPDGIVRIVETSRSAKSVSASVLGIGVAVMDSRLHSFPLFFRASLCCTPNLCCSSIIVYLRFLKATSEEKRA